MGKTALAINIAEKRGGQSAMRLWPSSAWSNEQGGALYYGCWPARPRLISENYKRGDIYKG